MFEENSTPKPPIITIVAGAGTGKTTLAGLFPNPVFIQAENSQTVFEEWDAETKPKFMPRLPRARKDSSGNLLSTKAALLEQIKQLIVNEHDRKTLIIDSVSTLSDMLEHELCVEYNVDNAADACGGFHKGYIALSAMHGEIRQACELLSKRKDMTIIFLSHLGIQKIKSSPETDEYSVYTLAMHEKSVHNYVNEADLVCYIKKDEFITGKQTDRKGNVTKFGKIMLTGDRKIITTSDGRVGYVSAKCRYGQMPAELDLPHGENPLMQYIPYYKNTTGE